jgi:hypothetical protein
VRSSDLALVSTTLALGFLINFSRLGCPTIVIDSRPLALGLECGCPQRRLSEAPNDQVHRAGATALDETEVPVAPAPVQPLNQTT